MSPPFTLNLLAHKIVFRQKGNQYLKNKLQPNKKVAETPKVLAISLKHQQQRQYSPRFFHFHLC